MIGRDEVFSIGRFLKPHGVKGETALSFERDIFGEKTFPYLVCDMDGILVPFFVRSFRYKGAGTALILFDGVNNDADAHRFDGVEAYLHRSLFKGEEMETAEDYSWNFFVGFSLEDERIGTIGVIEDVDDDTANVLFVVITPDGEEVLVPAAEDLITGFDETSHVLRMQLPDGLID